MIAALLVLAAASAAVPDGARLRPDRACYAITRGEGPQARVIGATLQSLERTTAGGRPAWRVVVHQRVGGGRFDMRDVLLLDAATLRPLSLASTRSGKPHARLAYAPGRVTGQVWDAAGVARAIDQPLAGPVWEGNLYGPTFAALPLAPGARFTLPFFQYDKGLGAFTVVVTGARSVATPDGPVEAWVLDAGPSPQERLEYLIAKESRRELGYAAPQGAQHLGGDCTGLD